MNTKGHTPYNDLWTLGRTLPPIEKETSSQVHIMFIYACWTIWACTERFYCIHFLIDVIGLTWTEEVEEALTVLSFCDRFSHIWSLPMLLFMHLLGQALPMIPINFGTEKQEQDQYRHSDFFLYPTWQKNIELYYDSWNISYPMASSRIPPSSSNMWYVFVSTEFLKNGFVSKWNSSLKPFWPLILYHLMSLRYLRASSSLSSIWKFKCQIY